MNPDELLASEWRARAEHLERCLAFLVGVAFDLAEDAENARTAEVLMQLTHKLFLTAVAVDLEAPLPQGLSRVRRDRQPDHKEELRMNQIRSACRAALARIAGGTP